MDYNLVDKFSLNLRTPSNLDDEEFNFLKNIKPDLVVVVAYGKIIPKRFLNIPKFGFINLHAETCIIFDGDAVCEPK